MKFCRVCEKVKLNLSIICFSQIIYLSLATVLIAVLLPSECDAGFLKKLKKALKGKKGGGGGGGKGKG